MKLQNGWYSGLIRKSGDSRIITVSSMFPIDWELLEMKVIEESEKSITIRFLKVVLDADWEEGERKGLSRQ